MVLPIQERRHHLRQQWCGDDVVVGSTRQDSELANGTSGAVEAGVTLAAAEQAVELDDVRGADRIGVGRDEEYRQLEGGDLLGPVVVLAQERAELREEPAPIDMSN